MSAAEGSSARLFRRIASGGVWAIAGRVGLGVTGLVVNALIARLLRPEDVGVYFLVVSGIGVAVVVSQLGLQHAVVRLVAEALGAGEPAQAGGVIRFILLVGCGLATLVGVVIGIFGSTAVGLFTDHTLVPGAAILMGIWVVAKTAEGLIAESFRGLHDIRLATLHSMLLGNLLLALLLGSLWLSSRADLLVVLALSVSATIAATVIGCRLLYCQLTALGPFVLPISTHVMGIAAPMFVTGVMLIVISQADLWIVARSLSAEQVAIYGAASRLVQLIMVPMLIVNAVIPPFVASLHREGRIAELEQIVRAAATVSCVPTACVLLVLWIAAAPLLEMVYGPFYRAGAETLVLISAGQLINGLVGASAMVLMMTGHQFSLMVISVLCGVFLIVGGLVMVEFHGMAGVAAATGLSIALHGILSLLWVKHKTGMWTHCGGLASIRQVRKALNFGH